jgi:hypothetical protein
MLVETKEPCSTSNVRLNHFQEKKAATHCFVPSSAVHIRWAGDLELLDEFGYGRVHHSARAYRISWRVANVGEEKPLVIHSLLESQPQFADVCSRGTEISKEQYVRPVLL